MIYLEFFKKQDETWIPRRIISNGTGHCVKARPYKWFNDEQSILHMLMDECVYGLLSDEHLLSRLYGRVTAESLTIQSKEICSIEECYVHFLGDTIFQWGGLLRWYNAVFRAGAMRDRGFETDTDWLCAVLEAAVKTFTGSKPSDFGRVSELGEDDLRCEDFRRQFSNSVFVSFYDVSKKAKTKVLGKRAAPYIRDEQVAQYAKIPKLIEDWLEKYLWRAHSIKAAPDWREKSVLPPEETSARALLVYLSDICHRLSKYPRRYK